MAHPKATFQRSCIRIRVPLLVKPTYMCRLCHFLLGCVSVELRTNSAGMYEAAESTVIQLYPLPFVYTVRSDLCEQLPTCGSAAIVRIQYPNMEKRVRLAGFTRISARKKIQYLIDLALNVITLTCLPPRLYAITPHHPPQSRPYEPSGQWPQHQSLPSASAAPPGPVPGH